MHAVRLIVSAVTALTLTAAVGCASEPEETVIPVPAQTTESTPTPEPEPEPEPMPGKGPACPTDHCVSVTVSGDLLFHEGLWSPFAIASENGLPNFDFMPLLEGQKPYLDRADLNICHMETPLAAPEGPFLGYPNFNTPPQLANTVKALGYDVCTTASNHTIDMGTEGLVRTLDTLDAAGIAHTGSYRTEEDSNEILIVEANGAKIAIILQTFSLNGYIADYDWQVDYPIDTDLAIEKAKRARELGADLVLGVQHVGEEYWTEPTPGQAQYAYDLYDSGLFDFVYQHHTHSIQPIEEYGGRWILYGTGNSISESAPPERRVNNEFLLTRVQFAKHEDGSWTTNDIAWTAATNRQGDGYKWCSVASDQPMGVCQWPEFDTDVRERTRATVNLYGADTAGAREWLITEE